jgi:hypothetical protein
MAELEAAVAVTEEIREQAEKLGYIVKQKGSVSHIVGSSCSHEIISPWDPWHVGIAGQSLENHLQEIVTVQSVLNFAYCNDAHRICGWVPLRARHRGIR